MLLTNLYYHVKPFVPRSLQIAIRRMIVQGKRPSYTDIWPIDERAGIAPEGWTGWPEGKEFAFVLTHDVEGPKGTQRCHKLAEVDRSFGFKSCFNFVPQGCDVSRSLREDLVADGFEIGVHGLCHDGNLFSSRRKFDKMSEGIARYLEEWDAVGFRTPSMYHNLEWIGEMNVDYDSSTFDTDPYEPQADGMRTIFPFWVVNQSTGRRYLELPYTLPQDFTLFVLMEERDTDVWKRKLDWIAANGGMALLITHPDYMNFGDMRNSMEEYPVGLYEDFLSYLKNAYEGKFWNALPKEVAVFCEGTPEIWQQRTECGG